MLLILLAFLITGCDDSIFSEDANHHPSRLDYINLTITEKEAQDTYWRISGTAINIGDYSTPTPWYIVASFDTNSVYTPDYVGSETIISYTSLIPEDTLYWELYHYNDNIIESNYSDFNIEILKAFEYSWSTP